MPPPLELPVAPVRPDITSFPREEVIAEMAKRGIIPPQMAQQTQGIPSLRGAERNLRLQQIAGEQDRVGLMNELARRKTQGEISALPTKSETEANQATRERAAGVASAAASEDPNIRAQSLNDQRNRAVETAYSQVVGNLPEQYEAPANITPKPFDAFFHENFAAQINAQQDPQFPLGSKEDNQLRAQNYNRLFSDPKTKSLYERYVTEAGQRMRAIPRGTPEYYDRLQEELVEKQVRLGLEAAKLKAIPGVLEQQAKGQAEAPGKVAEASKKLRDEIQGNKALENNRLKLAASEQIRQITSKPNPTNQDDLALIYAMVRALDPVSAVREGEVSLLKKGAGLPDQIVIEWNRIFGNKNAVLNPQIRQNIRDIAESEERTARVLMKPELERYQKSVESQGLNPEEIFSSTEQSVLSGQTGSSPGMGGQLSAASVPRISREEADASPTVTDPKLAPSTARYIKSPDGRTFLNPNFKQ